MIKSVPVFIIIFAYFIIYIIIGFILFANSKVSSSFITLNESMYTVFILFTVSNYPDVQTPYFSKDRLSMLYFWSFLLIGIFILSNLLLAQIFLNYKKLIHDKLKRYEKRVDDYFRKLFEDIKTDKERIYLTTDEFTEVMGGVDIVSNDKRLSDLIWQSKIILEDKICFQDFVYVLQFTDSVE